MMDKEQQHDPEHVVRLRRTMVAKKYLCSAPHPSTWDDHADALLKSLGGNQKTREHVLRQTLDTLEELYSSKKKIGPGRKSNAENAISFYLHVIEVNKTRNTLDHSADRNDNRPNRCRSKNSAESSKKKIEEEEDKEEDVEDQEQQDDQTPEEEEEEEENEEVEDQEEDDQMPEEEEEEQVENEDEQAQQDEEGEDNEEGEREDEQESTSDDKGEERKSESSMDSKEFLEQHNDQCEVCNLGGQLLCCSTCNLVFHLECVRPPLKELPKDNWSCAFCIASGVTGHSRESKVRKRAKAAVRAMARLSPIKQRHASDHDTDSDEGEEQLLPSSASKSEAMENSKTTTVDEGTVKETTEKATPKEREIYRRSISKQAMKDEKDQTSLDEAKDSATTGKRKLDINRLRDALSPSVQETPSEARLRRSRRQPTLYDPQVGAARNWQSDVALSFRSPSSNEFIKDGVTRDDAEEKAVEAEAKTADEDDDCEESMSNKKTSKATESVWCNFCKDNKDIRLCCFCACRVCFGKHDASKLLICDNCDDEYHIFCLDPPLQTVPSTQKWFCANCQATERKEKSAATVGTRSSTRSPNGQGKPSSPVSYGTRSTAAPKKTLPRPSPPTVPSVKEEPTPIQIKRKVGRPRKQEELTSQPPPVKKRGRPPKSLSSTSEDEEQKPRKRGRPRKSEKRPTPSEDIAQPIRKRGRPRKFPLGVHSNKNTSESSRPSKKFKSSHADSPTSQVTAQMRASSKVRIASTNGPWEERTPTQTSLVVLPLNVASVFMPELPDTRPGDQLSHNNVKLRASIVSLVDPVLDPSENSVQTLSGQSSLVSQPGSGSPSKAQRSRSGRMVKRSSFHDEIIEGEQHLRSPRYTMEIQRKAATSMATEAIKKTTDFEVTANHSFETVENTKPRPNPPMMPALNTPSLKSPPTVENEPDQINFVASTYVETRPTTSGAIQGSLAASIPPIEAVTESRTAEIIPVENNVASLPPPLDSSAVQSNIEDTAVPQPVASEPTAKNPTRIPRRKPGARECMQISRRFGAKVIPKKYMDILLDYCTRGKVEHLIRMRERLDSHSRFLESQLAGLEALVKEKGELDLVVPPMPGSDKDDKLHPAANVDF